MNSLAGSVALTRLALRRDRFSLPSWTLGLTAFATATSALWINDFQQPTANLAQEVQVAATNPGIRMLGLASGPTVGAYAMVRDFLLLAVLAALMSTFAVVRHTRQGEESGRAELVGAAAVGRYASLAAALVVAAVGNVALAVLLGLGLTAVGLPASGSFAAGAAVAAVGLSFAGVAAMAAQLASSTRAASGLTAAVLGFAFLTSGIGNMAGQVEAGGLRVHSAWPAWLSPIGWGQQMRPYGGNHWWILVLPIALCLACTSVAILLAGRRDFGQGLLPQRRGHGEAGPSLQGTFGLAWRLQRGAFIGWAIGMLGFGLVMGGLIGQVSDSTGAARDWYTRMGGSDQILDAYRASVLQMAGMGAAIYVVQVMLRLRTDESDGPLEQILAAAVSRFRWAGAQAAVASLGATALLLLFATGTGLAAGGVLGDRPGQVRTLLGAAVVQLPGVLIAGAVVLAAVGFLPRWAGAVSWTLLLGFILIGPLFGPTLGLPQWAQDLSPFTHIPKAPAVAITAAPLAGVIAAVAAISLAGLLALRHRNLVLPA